MSRPGPAEGPGNEGPDGSKPASQAQGPPGELRPRGPADPLRQLLRLPRPRRQGSKAGLRLDTKEGALAKLKSGDGSVVPGKPDESDLVFRHRDRRPRAARCRPKKRQAADGRSRSTSPALDRAGGAVDDALGLRAAAQGRPARRSRTRRWPRNPIDRFILARLEAEGLKPVAGGRPDDPDPPRHARPDRPAADAARSTPSWPTSPPTPMRRWSTGCCDSPRYGEHMARYWLDAARYGDTHGLHLDNYREIWPYRDWVIKAFNDNMPFDHFVVEQLAGDLLPNPTLDQHVATGFNRCHVSTSEGGSIEEEVYVRNVVDQVDTNGTVFLGLTVGCARCHDHKYDPIRTKDYYQLFAFFNNIDGPALDGNVAQSAADRQGADRRADAARSKPPTTKIAALARQIAAEAGEGGRRLRRQGRRRPGRVVQRERLRLDRRRAARRGQAADEGRRPRGSSSTRPDHPVFSGQSSLRHHGQGLKQRFFNDAGPEAQGRRGRQAVRLRLPRPDQSAQGDHAPVAHDGLDAPGLLGREPDRLGQGRHARAARGSATCPPAGKWVRLEVDGQEARPQARARSSTAGRSPSTDGTVYWDKAGIETWTPQEGQRLRHARRLGPGPARPSGGGTADRPQGDRQASTGEADRGPEEAAAATTSSSTPTRRRSRRSTRSTHQLAEAEQERKQIDDADPDDAGLPREDGRRRSRRSS